VNGVSVTEKVQVKHGGRILLGNNHLYRLSCPHTVGQNGENELMDYEQAMKEISINELTNGEGMLPVVPSWALAEFCCVC